MRRFVTLEQENEICKRYLNGETSYSLAKEFGFKGHKSITDIIKAHGISTRNTQEEQQKHTGYANFSIANIDSPEKAYFLGLILTDGYVLEKYKVLGISLTDKDAIDAICSLTGASYYEVPIRDKMTKPAYRVHLHGERFLKEISRFGVKPKKTYTLSDINLKDNEIQFFPYVLRGIIDGDGWISKDGKEFFISTASENFAKFLVGEMNKLGFSVSYSFKSNEYSGYYLIRSAKSQNINLLKNIVYDKPYGMMYKYNRIHSKDVQRL